MRCFTPRFVLLSFIGLGLSGCIVAQSSRSALTADQRSVVTSVETLFRSLSLTDRRMLDSVTDPGFYLFDGGQRVSSDVILSFVQQLRASGTEFTWTVTEPDVHIHGSSAWIAYVDRGSKRDSSGSTPMVWLESAVLNKEAGRWRLAFLHSTPVAGTSPER